MGSASESDVHFSFLFLQQAGDSQEANEEDDQEQTLFWARLALTFVGSIASLIGALVCYLCVLSPRYSPLDISPLYTSPLSLN